MSSADPTTTFFDLFNIYAPATSRDRITLFNDLHLRETQVEKVTLAYINNDYYIRKKYGMQPTNLAWTPQHWLSFEKTSNEIRERYANTRKDLAYDIDAFKAFLTLGSLNRGIKLPMQLFSRLNTRFTTNEKKAKVVVRSGVSPGYKSVAVREISNLQIDKFNIPHLGETGIYMIFPDLYVSSSRHTKADMSQTDVINLERHIISAIKLECDGLHVDCKRPQISEALLYSVTAQYLFSREARESAYISQKRDLVFHYNDVHGK
jgi:hypothetical protein